MRGTLRVGTDYELRGSVAAVAKARNRHRSERCLDGEVVTEDVTATINDDVASQRICTWRSISDEPHQNRICKIKRV